MTNNFATQVIEWVRLAKVGDVQGHQFRGNQYDQEANGGSSSSDAKTARQADPNRNQVSSDRYGSSQTTNDAKPAIAEKPAPKELPNHDTRIKSDPSDESPKVIRKWAQEIHFALMRGEQPIISSRHMPALLAEMARSRTKGNDITNLRIDGTRLMGLDGKGYSRSKMPQIDEKDRPQFLKDIEESNGITVKPMRIDPTTLKPIQKEINGDKSGGIMAKNPDGIPDGMRILVSKDGYVVDGHHTWAAAVALKFAGKSSTIPVYQLSCDWKTAMDVGLAWDKKHNVKLQGFDTPAPPTPDTNSQK